MVALSEILALHRSDDTALFAETPTNPQRRRGHQSDSVSRKIPPRMPWPDAATWSLVALTTAVLPCVISVSGKDLFRTPKELLLRGSAIVIAMFVLLSVIYAPADLRQALSSIRVQASAAGVVVGWMLVTTLTSTNRLLSVSSSIYVAACAIYFLAASYTIRGRTWHAVYILFIPALINTVVLVLQEFRIWDINALSSQSTHSALVGNSNDTGAFLLSPAIAAAALSVATPVRRLLHIVIAATLIVGIALSQCLTAAIAYAVAVAAIYALESWKKALVGGTVIALVLAAAAVLYAPIRARTDLIRKSIVRRDYNALTSFRLTPFAAAAQMFSKRPIVGVGPGCYALWYFDEKITAEDHHAILQNTGDPLHNYEEAHNDYLQALAVGGFPALTILIMLLLVLGSTSFRRVQLGIGGQLARRASFPLAVGLSVLFMAGFPLELAASTVSILFATAICSTGRSRARS